jgi:hypothetical protein
MRLRGTPITVGAAPVYSAPINITDALIVSNGSNVFTGNWENTSYSADNGAAVYVTATQPVILENCRFKAQKYCVSSLSNGSNITVRNCIGVVKNTTQAGQPAHRFLNVEQGSTVVCENNTMIGGGIYLYQQASVGGLTLVRIRYNRAINIDGRLSDGAGGIVFERANTANVYFQAKQFLQMNAVRGATNVDVSWNEIVNEPFFSRPEDVISIYASSGTSLSPISVANNFLWGCFSSRPHELTSYSGGGILCDGGSSTWTDEATVACKWINIDDNQAAMVTQYGISVAYGNNINVRRNRIICPNTLRGRTLTTANVGAYTGGGLRSQANGFNANISIDNNVIGCVNTAGSQNNSSLSGWIASGVASASAGTKTRVTFTHGLTAAENGLTLDVASGTNWTPGSYVLTYVDASNLDLDVAWNAAFGNPTIRSATIGITNTTSVPFPDEGDAQDEWDMWRDKVAAAGVTLGASL